MAESVDGDVFPEEKLLSRGHSWELDESKSWPAGWWILPSAFLGLCAWTYVIYSVIWALAN